MGPGSNSRPAGVVIPFWLGRPPQEAMQVALLAEQLHYPELWVGEMLHFDAFALAGAIAAMTTEVTITVGPLSIGLRDPVLLAMGVGSVSVIGRRPARLALGASSPAVVADWHGRLWGGESNRMTDALRLIRSVLSGERTDHEGDFSSHGFRTALGSQPAHLTVAAAGSRMMGVAAAAADRIVLNLVPVEEVERAVATGKPVAVWLAAAVDPEAAGLAQLRRQLTLYLAAPGYSAVLTKAGLGAPVEAARQGVPPSELAEMLSIDQINRVAAVGDADHVARRIESYQGAGAAVMVVPVTGGDPGGGRTLSALA
ncbi:MAG: LLM class F420-dependent oxidoreductase [Acidimicrobiia bacterium]